MSICEGIFSELNKYRSNPVAYSLPLGQFLSIPADFPRENPDLNLLLGDVSIESLECFADHLTILQELPEFKWSGALSMAAEDLINDIWDAKDIDCTSDGKTMLEDRISAFCNWSGKIGKNIHLGSSEPEEIILGMLIDTHCERAQINNILIKQYKYVGVAYRLHKRMGSICVIIFAEYINPIHPLTKSSNKFPRKCAYAICKEIPCQYSSGKTEDTNKINYSQFEEIRSLEISEFSDREFREIQKLIEGIDTDLSGTINISDINSLFESTINDRDHSSCCEVFKGIDFGTAEKLRVDELIDTTKYISRTGTKNYSFNNEMFSEIKEVFDLIDCDKSSFISQENISIAMQNASLESYSTIIHELNLELDSNQNQKISLEEFQEIASKNFNSARIIQNDTGETCQSVTYLTSKEFLMRKSSF